MKDFKCPKCGKPHESEARFCYFCKTDLEDAILEYKEKHLPIRFEHKIPTQLPKHEVDSFNGDKTEEKLKPEYFCCGACCIIDFLFDWFT